MVNGAELFDNTCDSGSITGDKSTTSVGTAAVSQSKWKEFVPNPIPGCRSRYLRAKDHEYFTEEELGQWFARLHPDNPQLQSEDGSPAAWVQGFYNSKPMLRQTAWCVLNPDCNCLYGYSDTIVKKVSNNSMVRVVSEIVERLQMIADKYGITTVGSEEKDGTKSRLVFDAVNLNYYPEGGGLGYHADDEPLFDGLDEETNGALILSFSLGSPSKEQEDSVVKRDKRKEEEEHQQLQIDEILATIPDEKLDEGQKKQKKRHARAKKNNPELWNEDEIKKWKEDMGREISEGDRIFQVAEWDTEKFGDKQDHINEDEALQIPLGHGDLLTMEGLFQKYYKHAVWPEDRQTFRDSPFVKGERINLTLRVIKKHLNGKEDPSYNPNGIKCKCSEINADYVGERKVEQ